jgi:amidase
MTGRDVEVTDDATAQAELVRAGTVSARSLVEKALDQIERLDGDINAFRVVLAEHALEAADRLDGRPVDDLPLAGVPVAIKDDTDVAGEVTAWGSSASRPPAAADADVVAKLRASGAIIIGKTNVPELTLWPWTASERWGTTRNPWNLDRTPGGSSGGSAAAVCTGMCALALGSDGGGSIRYPAGLTGVVGLKPQRGRVPMGREHGSGWHGLLALGPLTRSVRDAALFLDVVANHGYCSALQQRAPRLRIAVATKAPPGTQASLSPPGRAAVDETVALLQGLGHELVDADIHYGIASLWNSTVRLLKGVQDDVDAVPNRDDLERRTRGVARLGRLLPARSLVKALERERDIAAVINAVFDGVDAILTPLCASPAPRVDDCPTTGALRSLRASNTSAWLVPWNVTGQPAISIPVGADEQGMPTAVQLVGPANGEPMLLRLAAEIEEHHPFRSWS